ncbi:hypothetical protein M3J09_006575 [Ascochyta lentis]
MSPDPFACSVAPSLSQLPCSIVNIRLPVRGEYPPGLTQHGIDPVLCHRRLHTSTQSCLNTAGCRRACNKLHRHST